MRAFVDESYNETRYLFGAALVEADHVNDARERMRQMLLPGQRKVHWRDEDQKRRLAIAETVGRTTASGLVVVRTNKPGERTERQRRLCMEAALLQLQAIGVDLALFESRRHRDDLQDQDFVAAMRARKIITSQVRIQHSSGADEPLLWIADALCGIVVAAQRGDRRYLDVLGDITIIETV